MRCFHNKVAHRILFKKMVHGPNRLRTTDLWLFCHKGDTHSGLTLNRCNRRSCIGPRAMVFGEIVHFCQIQLALENSVETPCKFHCWQRTLSSELANFLSNVSKCAHFSCRCFTVYLRSTTIVIRLTEHDDVIKSLLRGAPRLGLALSPALARACPARTASNKPKETVRQIDNESYDWHTNSCTACVSISYQHQRSVT